MVKKNMYKKILELKKQGKSRRKISRELGLDKKTVSKYYKLTEEEFRKIEEKAHHRNKLFNELEDEILGVYKANDYQRINVSSIYDYLEEKHGILPASEKTLRNYVKYLVETNRLEFNEKIRVYTGVPELPPGRQMQLDFGEHKCKSGLKLYIFAAVLSSSRYKYSIFQDRPFKTKDVIRHLLNCFDYIGGIPSELVIDQDRLLVVSENNGDIIYTKDFKYFTEEMDLKMYVCRKADPESKGKVENTIKFVKNNFLASRDFINIDEANESLSKWLTRRANGKICQATKQVPNVLIEAERNHLKPIRNSIFGKESMVGRESRLANEKSLISVNASQYTLPSKYRNREVEIFVTSNKLFVFDCFDGREIAEYDLSLIPGKIVSKRKYGRLTEKSSQELKDEVLCLFEDDSWRVFTSHNFKTFPRYVRDQCIEGMKYFKGREINGYILKTALKYCLENKTYSFANLQDTYNHFMHMNREQSKTAHNIVPHIHEAVGNHDKIDVKKRDISLYKSILKDMEAGLNEIL